MNIISEKIQFCQKEVPLLGMISIGKEKIALNEKKVTIKNISRTKWRRIYEAWALWGGSRIYQNFAESTRDLTNGLRNKKQFTWNDAIEDEFIQLKSEKEHMQNLTIPN